MTTCVRIHIDKDTELPDRYAGIFHGKTILEKGTYHYYYPVGNISYSRLVHELNRWYGIKVEYGMKL